LSRFLVKTARIRAVLKAAPKKGSNCFEPFFALKRTKKEKKAKKKPFFFLVLVSSSFVRFGWNTSPYVFVM
jgi:hypothetical protein